MNTLFERNITNYKDEWLTPLPIIQSLGQFDLDPCSPINRPWNTAQHHYTIEDNGLQKNWFGRVWCNPPYSDIENWVKKCAYHANSTLLVFARTETEWFFRHIWNKADSIFFFANRIRFYDVNGNKAASNSGAPSVLVAYGKINVEALADSNLQGKHIPLNYTPIIIVGISPKWISVVTIAVNQFGDQQLKPIYDMVERIAPDKISNNQHWKAKVRQQLQLIRKNNTNAKLKN